MLPGSSNQQQAYHPIAHGIDVPAAQSTDASVVCTPQRGPAGMLPMHAGSPCLLGLPTDAEFCHARQGAPPGTLQVTGVLGLALFLAGFFHIRGSGAIFITQSPPPPPPPVPRGNSLSLLACIRASAASPHQPLYESGSSSHTSSNATCAGRSKPRQPSTADGDDGASSSSATSRLQQLSQADSSATPSASAQQRVRGCLVAEAAVVGNKRSPANPAR